MNYDLDFQFSLNDGRDPCVQNSKVEGQLVIKLQWKQTDRRVDRKVRFDLINVKITFTHNDSSYMYVCIHSFCKMQLRVDLPSCSS